MRQTLDETLTELQDQLAHLKDLDQEQLEKLRAAAQQISDTLDHQDVSSATLAQRLQEATRQFEQSHPQLTTTVGRIADLLAQLGI